MGRHSPEHVVREPRHMGLLDIAKRLKGQNAACSLTMRFDPQYPSQVWLHLLDSEGMKTPDGPLRVTHVGKVDLESAESSQIGGDAVVEQLAEALFDKMHARLNKETKANG